MKLFTLSLLIIATITSANAFAGNEGPGLAPIDPCGAPVRLDYVQLVVQAGIQGCGDYMSDFSTTKAEGAITNINGLQDPNLLYSVSVQDPATGKTLASVVKCDVSTGTASILTLDFHATTSYGGCSL
jgi:hypothetical protein